MSDEQSMLTKAQRRELPIPLSEAEAALAERVVSTLNERNPDALRQIQALVHRCGIDLVEETLAETLRVEAEGGLMVTSGERRRTPGGVFLHLMSRQLSPEIRRETIYLYQIKKNKGKKKSKNNPSQRVERSQPKVKVETPEWEFYRSFHDELSNKRGVATTVKITLIGRPGKVKIQQETVVTQVEHVVKSSSLPKGVPAAPTTPTTYTVYMGLKQWRKVESVIKSNPEDALIIEGVCAFDPVLQAMVVFASNTTTKALEIAKREGQKGKATTQAGASGSSASASSASASATSTSFARSEAPPPPPATLTSKYPIPPNMPPADAQKLHDLYSAADQFRQKIAALETLPADQRLGYAMTQKLLKNTEDQITALERRYK